MTDESIKDIVIEEVDQAYNEFIFYARKNDKRLPLKAIEAAILDGHVSIYEIVEHFRDCLERTVGFAMNDRLKSLGSEERQ